LVYDTILKRGPIWFVDLFVNIDLMFVCLFGTGTENEHFGFSQVPLAAVPYAKKARNFSSLLPRFIVRIPPSFPPFYRDEVPRAYRRDLQGMVCTVILLLAAWFLFRLGYRLAEKRSGRRERPGSNRVGACRVDEKKRNTSTRVVSYVGPRNTPNRAPVPLGLI